MFLEKIESNLATGMLVLLKGRKVFCTNHVLEYVPENERRQPRRMYGKRGREIREEMEAGAVVQEACDDYIAALGEGKYDPETKDVLLSMDQNMFDECMIVELIRFICKTQKDGAILVFVPGMLIVVSR